MINDWSFALDEDILVETKPKLPRILKSLIAITPETVRAMSKISSNLNHL